MLASHTAIDRLVQRAGHLYSLPSVAVRVLELTENPQVDTRALKECIENDPALAGKVLRVVNSSLFGLSREISDLNQALALLGIKPLKLLVLGFSLPAGLFSDITAQMLAGYWRHTLTKAVAAREISEQVFHQGGDEAFLAGLLQDLGMLVLIQELGDPYVAFLEKVQSRGADLAAMETRALGFEHTALSARLLEQWKLPQALVEAVGATDGCPAEPASDLEWILFFAERIAQWLSGRASALDELLSSGPEGRRLTPAAIERLVATLEDKVRQLADVLSLQLPEGLDFREILLRSQARLAEVATEAAAALIRRRGYHPAGAEVELLTEIASLEAAVAEATSDEPCPVGAAVHSAGARKSPPSESPVATARAIGARSESESDLRERLANAVAACRQARCSLSLLLVSWSDPDALLLTVGLEGFHRLRATLLQCCRALDAPGMICLPNAEGLALILPDCDRRQSTALGSQLVDDVRRVSRRGVSEGRNAMSISVGVATLSLPPKNFPAGELLQAATRCLNGSSASGGNVVKSIEIF